MPDHTIWELAKNSRELYRCRLGEYKGHKFIDLRLYLQGDGQDPLPTKRGLTIGPHLWPQFRQALGKVDDALVEVGWLDREDLYPEG